MDLKHEYELIDLRYKAECDCEKRLLLFKFLDEIEYEIDLETLKTFKELVFSGETSKITLTRMVMKKYGFDLWFAKHLIYDNYDAILTYYKVKV